MASDASVTIESVVDSILDQTRDYLQFPSADDISSGKPSLVLDYRLNASIFVSLDVDWSLFAGFTLNNVSLTTDIDKCRDVAAVISVGLSATCTIGEQEFVVSGEIPSLTRDVPVAFLLRLQIADAQGYLNPHSFLNAFTSNTFSLAKEMKSLDSTLSDQIGADGAAERAWAAGATLLIERETNGTFSMKSLSIQFAANMSWALIPERIEIDSVSLQLQVSREAPTLPWHAQVMVKGDLLVGTDTAVNVSGRASITETVDLSLTISATPLSSVALDAILPRLLGTDKPVPYPEAELPPSLTFPTPGEPSFEVQLHLCKDGSGWFIEQAHAKLFPLMSQWGPPEQPNVFISSLFFLYDSKRDSSDIILPARARAFKHVFLFGGSLSLYGASLDASVIYQSEVATTTFTCILNGNKQVSLQDLVSDAIINPPGAMSAHNLGTAATAMPIPDSVPVDLDWGKLRMSGENKMCILDFKESELKRVRVKADFDVQWSVARSPLLPKLELINMGVLFDITNPIAADKTTLVRGYAYGKVLVADVSVFAFVAGIASPVARSFEIGLSVSSDPGSALGVGPQSIFGDILGKPVPASDWKLPLSFPEDAAVERVLEGSTSAEAFMSLRVSQTIPETEDKEFKNQIEAIKASIGVHGEWELLPGVKLQSVVFSILAIPPVGTNEQASYYAELAGEASGTLTSVDNTIYTVVLTACLQRSVDQSLRFQISVSAYLDKPEQSMPLSQFLKTGLIGLDKIDVLQDPSAKAVPSGLPTQPLQLMSLPAASCSLTVAKKDTSWEIDRLKARLEQNSPWIIVPEKLKVTRSCLELEILRPRAVDRMIRFFASATLTINSSINIDASISIEKFENSEDSLTLIVQSGSLPSILQQVVGFSIDVPETCPVLHSGYVFELKIVCKYSQKDSSWKIRTVSVCIWATPGTTWSLGGLVITDLLAEAFFDNIGTPESTTSLCFKGNATFLGTVAELRMTYSPQIMVVSLGTAVKATQIVGAFIPEGLNASSLSKLLLPESTGLSRYQDISTADAKLTFKYQGSGGWQPDTISVSLHSSDTWTLATDMLKATGLDLNIMLSGISSTKKELRALLQLKFEFKLPPPSEKCGTLLCSLVATENMLQGTINTTDCSLPRFLYVATAGFWIAPDWLDFPAITPQSLKMTIDFKKSTAEFLALCRDWSLAKTIPRLVSINGLGLRVSVRVSRPSSQFSASGTISGKAIVLNVEIPVSFELPYGPFKLFDIDVREAYKLAKRLYEALKDAKAVAEIVAQLAELEGAAEAAAGVFAALVAAGVAERVVQELIDEKFGGNGGSGNGGKPPASNQDDPTRDGNTINPAKQSWLTLGGSLQSAGPAGEMAELVVYPKDKYGNPLPINPAQLFLTRPEATVEPKDIPCQWNQIANGHQTFTARPSENCFLAVQYRSTSPLENRFKTKIQQEISRFSLVDSVLRVPDKVECERTAVAVFVPCDQFKQSRRGPSATPPLKVRFTNNEQNPAPQWDSQKGLVRRNDCALLPFTLCAPGTYTLCVYDDTSQVATSVIGVVAISPSDCILYGSGLCSGSLGEQVEVFIKLVDQYGNSFIPPSPEGLDIDVVLETPSIQGQSLIWSLRSDTISTTYTRPDTECEYSVSIFMDGELINDESTNLLATRQPINADVSKSICKFRSLTDLNTLKEPTFAVGDRIRGSITTFDSKGYRYRGGNLIYKVTWPSDFRDATLTMGLDGTSIAEATIAQSAPQNAEFTITVTKIDDQPTHAVGSPFSVPLKAARQLSFVTVFGSGLSPAQDSEAQISLKGRDQYQTPYKIRFESNCRMITCFPGSRPQYARDTGEATVSFHMPSVGAPPAAILVRPIEGASTFREMLFVVPVGPSGSPCALKSFVVWDRLTQTGTSRATLYVADSSGNRYYQGGSFIQVLSDPQAPSIILTLLQDNSDGSYTFDLLLPPEAFTSLSPLPSLRVLLDNELVGGKAIAFPLTPPPMVTAVASGPGLSSAKEGYLESFTISCLDTSGQLTSSGFQSASAHLILAGSDTPLVTECTVSSIQTGRIELSYRLPVSGSNTPVQDYNLHIMVNSRPLPESPFVVRAQCSEVDVDEAWRVTHYIVGQPPERWAVGLPRPWAMSNIESGETLLRALPSHPSQIDGSVELGLRLPSTEAWFQSGFVFSFDITIAGGPLKLTPKGASGPDQIFMQYTPDQNERVGGRCQWLWTASNKVAKVANPDNLIIGMVNPTTICFVYTSSANGALWTLHIFQAGQYIASTSWAPASNDTSTLPQPSLSLSRVKESESKVYISNVTTVPTKYPVEESFVESATETMLSEPWAAKYFDGPYDGTLVTGKGLEFDEWKMDGPSKAALKQERPSTYGCSITIYTFTVKEIADLRARSLVGPPPRLWFPPLSALFPGGWFDGQSLREAVNIRVNPEAKQTMIVMSGKDFSTSISNGELGYVNAKNEGIVQPQLKSWSVGVIWHSLRVYPPLQKVRDL
ncbi:hypothetical protein K458DRAFT_427565 [Lentithecium fluviatile CBS 122367]|uniref:Uncharacterized protein n=1 Tax=Lentithecium fluviatile CBS 122367 TaxID=1168545 RepID=A0A6G1JFR4_9PLEO|nr:hypothetical protein K458DRAFT_427565 [Lentithecium fluviatile CBS 122367]